MAPTCGGGVTTQGVAYTDRKGASRFHPGEVLTVGRWWGNAPNAQWRAGRRTTEEIDGIGLNRTRVAALEAIWTSGQVSADVFTDLLTLKLPAMAQAGFDTEGTEIVFACRSGFTAGTKKLAAKYGSVYLVTADEVLTPQPS